MKVILLRDVAKMGKRFSIVEVPDGYALNKLIPQGLAQPASAENLKRIQARSEKQTSDKATEVSVFKTAIVAIKEKGLQLTADANEQKHLFKSIKAADIAQAAALIGAAIPVDSIKLVEPIKALGEYQVPVALDAVHDVITVSIIAK